MPSLDELNVKFGGCRVRVSGDHPFAGDEGKCLELFYGYYPMQQTMMKIKLDMGATIFCNNTQVEILHPTAENTKSSPHSNTPTPPKPEAAK